MRHKFFCLISTCLTAAYVFSTSVTVMALDQTGQVSIVESTVTPPIDPENPIEGGDLTESPSTIGSLRIDYVSPLNFGKHSTQSDSRDYLALAQEYKDGPRPHYIQITSSSSYSGGWTLQVKQDYQFRQSTDTSKTLTGAVLTFGNRWVNSIDTTSSPTIASQPLSLISVGEVYDIAHAKSGEGKGTWVINFGASNTNVNGQIPTIEPIAMNTKSSTKTIYQNKAVQLSIPNRTPIYAGSYETKVTWMLSKLP